MRKNLTVEVNVSLDTTDVWYMHTEESFTRKYCMINIAWNMKCVESY